MPSADRVTVLREHRDRTVLVQRHDRAGSGMANYGQIEFQAIGQRDTLEPKIDHANFQNRATVRIHRHRMRRVRGSRNPRAKHSAPKFQPGAAFLWRNPDLLSSQFKSADRRDGKNPA